MFVNIEGWKLARLTVEDVGTFVFWVIDGAALRGWNAVKLTKDDFDMLKEVNAVGRPLTESELDEPDEVRLVEDGIYAFCLGSGFYEELEPDENGLYECLIDFERGETAFLF